MWYVILIYCYTKFTAIGEEGSLGSDDDDMPVLKRLDDIQNTVLASPDSKHVDLFSEIHLNELKKLEKQLEQVIMLKC